MLNAAFVNRLQAVEWGVMHMDAVDVGEIEPLDAVGGENIQIGYVRQALVNLGGERIGNWFRGGLGHLADEPSVVVGRIKHDRRAALAEGVKIECDLNIFCRRMLLGKCHGAEKADLFGIAKEKDDVIGQ